MPLLERLRCWWENPKTGLGNCIPIFFHDDHPTADSDESICCELSDDHSDS